MKFKTLLKKSTSTDIVNRMYEIYAEAFVDPVTSEVNYECKDLYAKILDTLKDTKAVPNKDNFRICLKRETPETDPMLEKDEESYDHLLGLNGTTYRDESPDFKGYEEYNIKPDDEQPWSLSMCNWNEWLAFDVDKDALKNYPKIDILAHSLYEMTFYGHTPQEINSVKDMLNERQNDIEKWKAEGTLDEHCSTMEELYQHIEDKWKD